LQEENKSLKKQIESKQESIVAFEKNTQNTFDNNQKELEIIINYLLQENRYLRDELGTVKQNMCKQETISSVLTKIEDQNPEIKANTEKIINLEQIFNGKCDQVENNQAQMKITIDKMAQDNAAMATKSEQNVKQIKTLEAKIVRIEENQNYGEFLWCVQNWGEKVKQLQDGTLSEICSGPFYSHKNGYKMRLILELYSDGSHKNITHLSLFICIMQGEFDNILQWPFRHKIRLDLMNQKTGLTHVTETVESEDNPSNNSWKKPIKEENIEYGYPRFIGLSTLFSNGALCIGDQILIKATPQIQL